MMPAKKEDGDRNRFIGYLKSTEGIEYRTVDVNVLSRSGNKMDFDYLLQTNTGETLALEVTWLADRDETAADEKEHHDFVQDQEKFLKLRELLESLILKERVPCGISIWVPYHVTCKERRSLNRIPADKLALVKEQLMAAIEGLWLGESVSAALDFGEFLTIVQIDGVSVGREIDFYPFGGHRGGIFDEAYFAAKIKKKIPHKNQQLDYQADRRVLLFGNAMPMPPNSRITRLAIAAAITNFIQTSPFEVSNIDEIYVDFGVNEIERVYRRS